MEEIGYKGTLLRYAARHGIEASHRYASLMAELQALQMMHRAKEAEVQRKLDEAFMEIQNATASIGNLAAELRLSGWTLEAIAGLVGEYFASEGQSPLGGQTVNFSDPR